MQLLTKYAPNFLERKRDVIKTQVTGNDKDWGGENVEDPLNL